MISDQTDGYQLFDKIPESRAGMIPANHYLFPIPEFNGNDPQTWLSRANLYFKKNPMDTVEEWDTFEKVKYVRYFMFGPAEIWFEETFTTEPKESWESFCEKVLHHFTNRSEKQNANDRHDIDSEVKEKDGLLLVLEDENENNNELETSDTNVSIEQLNDSVAFRSEVQCGEEQIIDVGALQESDGFNLDQINKGGGTFDVSILAIDNGVFEVFSINGDTHLGDKDFDQRVMEYFIKLIKKKYGKDISKDNIALGKLRREAERAKRALSSQHQVRVEIESLFDGVDFSEPLTRARFEELNNDLFRKTMGPVKKAMEDAGLEKRQIDEIVLVGGNTRIPKIQQLLKEYFDGKEPNKGVNPNEAVVYGAEPAEGTQISSEVIDEEKSDDSKKTLGCYISTEDFDDYFEKTTKDALSGGSLADASNESIFFVDKSRDLPVKRRIDKSREKVLRVDSVLQGNPFIQAVPTSTQKSKKTLKKKEKGAEGNVKDGSTSASGLADLWEEKDEIKRKSKKNSKSSIIPAVEVEHPGCSFNPDPESHQDALAVVVADEMQKIYQQELGHVPIPLTVTGEIVDDEEKYFLDGDEGTDDDEQNEELGQALDGADVVIIPAGVPRKPGMTRDDLFKINAGIVKSLILAIAKYCLHTLIKMFSNPVNSTEPSAAEILKRKGVYDERRLFGVITMDVATPKANISNDVITALTKRTQDGGMEFVEAKAGKGSATLSMAYAGALFADACLKGRNGVPDVVEYSYVQSTMTELPFFASKVKLGKNIFKLSQGEYVAVEMLESTYSRCSIATFIWDPGGENSGARISRRPIVQAYHNLEDKVVFKREALSRFHFSRFYFYLNVLQLTLVTL